MLETRDILIILGIGILVVIVLTVLLKKPCDSVEKMRITDDGYVQLDDADLNYLEAQYSLDKASGKVTAEDEAEIKAGGGLRKQLKDELESEQLPRSERNRIEPLIRRCNNKFKHHPQRWKCYELEGERRNSSDQFLKGLLSRSRVQLSY